jgi:rhamnulokinase
MSQAEKILLAVDLGASSGRLIAGRFNGSRLELEELHRFENGPVIAADRMHWDVLRLWASIQEGMRVAARRFGESVASIGVDTWGVDFGLLARGDELLGNPVHYRDRRTQGMMQRAFGIVSREDIFAETGLQFMELNTLYQLLAMKFADSPLLETADRLLMIPDLFHWLMSGEKSNEMTDVSTTQCYNPKTGDWAWTLLEKFGLPSRIFGPIIPPGTKLGPLRPHVADETGLRSLEVILPGAHDTASAVMAAPAVDEPSNQPDWCYISSGTWSLMGVETPDPIINDTCRRLNFTNEGGVGGTVRVLKNIAGLWLVQECRRIWAAQGRERSFAELVEMARQAAPLRSLIDPDHGSFVAPANMPTAIRDFCQKTGQPAPDREGPVIRCALESLALRYRQALGWLEELTGGAIGTIHIVGGGVKNELLCQMTADATGRRVVAGPSEATAVGNLTVQAVSLGLIGSIADARRVVCDSFACQEYQPKDTAAWDEAFGRFEAITSRAASIGA